jgi:inosine-uridine nucleoside N-ribohydrolase
MTTPLRRHVVLDTDTFNEVDDQFALAHLLLSPDQIELEAVYAAPFLNSRSTGPGDGMEKSYEEIVRLIEVAKPEVKPPVLRGSSTFLPAANTPVESEAAADLVQRALAPRDGKLYVAAIAAATNIASALLIEPKIAERIVITWLGGHAPYWPDTGEFNLAQDLHAARVLLDMDVPLVLLPCLPVASHLITTVAELERDLEPHSKLGAYLTNIVRDYEGNPPGWSKVIWDIAATAWLLDESWVPTEEASSPVLRDDVRWEAGDNRRLIQIARQVQRDDIFADFFAKARRGGAGGSEP